MNGATVSQAADIVVKATKKVGRLSDGGNLYLRVSDTGLKPWSFMWGIDKNPQEMDIKAFIATLRCDGLTAPCVNDAV